MTDPNNQNISRARARMISTPGICGGRPRIPGTRIEPRHMLGLAEHGLESFLRDHPHIAREDAKAALMLARIDECGAHRNETQATRTNRR